ncbi:hypothetical protein CLOM_g5516 [Closterium sp. NIES-68]|nr:hypothetical protein CLOM_g5516 [Closterium sp. NIES-68]GJP73978.1 hypothetical protein CLOP_g4637 [Closterium sp. NIES-67]
MEKLADEIERATWREETYCGSARRERAPDALPLLNEGLHTEHSEESVAVTHSRTSSASSVSSFSSTNISQSSAGRDVGIDCGSSSDGDSDAGNDGGYISVLAAEGEEERAEEKGAKEAPSEEAALARPAHPAALHALYWTFIFNCFAEQSWRFAGAALLALLHHSWLPVVVARFVSQLVACVAAPLVGDLMDSAPRLPALRIIVVAQATAIVVGAVATMHALHLAYPAAAAPAAAATVAASYATSALSALPATAVLQQGWFAVLLVAGAVERLMGLASGVAVEMDWVVVLVGEDQPVLMASAMAMLGRIEQCCEVAGAFTFGWVIATCGPLVCAKACLALAALSIPGLLALTALTNHLSQGALGQSSSLEISPSQGSLPAAATDAAGAFTEAVAAVAAASDAADAASDISSSVAASDDGALVPAVSKREEALPAGSKSGAVNVVIAVSREQLSTQQEAESACEMLRRN